MISNIKRNLLGLLVLGGCVEMNHYEVIDGRYAFCIEEGGDGLLVTVANTCVNPKERSPEIRCDLEFTGDGTLLISSVFGYDNTRETETRWDENGSVRSHPDDVCGMVQDSCTIYLPGDGVHTAYHGEVWMEYAVLGGELWRPQSHQWYLSDCGGGAGPRGER